MKAPDLSFLFRWHLQAAFSPPIHWHDLIKKKCIYMLTGDVYCQTFTLLFGTNYSNYILCNCAILWRGCCGDK